MQRAIASTELPPGPWLSRSAQKLRWAARPLPFLEQCSERYGDVFTLRLSRRPTVIVCDPALVKQLFTGRPDTLHAGQSSAILDHFVGTDCLVRMDGPAHLERRRLLLPPFHGSVMERYAGTIIDVADRHLKRWPIDKPVAMRPLMQDIVLEIIVRVIFGGAGPERQAAIAERLGPVLDTTANRAQAILLGLTRRWTFRGTPWGRIVRALAAAEEVIRAEIADCRRADTDERDDVLAVLLRARDERGRALSDTELRDELIFLMLAAHETTASALAWAMERLTHHPDVRALVEQDLAEGDHRYLDAVIAETLRQRPPVLVVARRVASPIQLGGWRLPAGVNVAAALHLLQHRPDRYPEPDCFRPERFLDRRPDGYAWIAFGGGVRRCIGASLALLELRLILQRLLARYELGPAVGAPEVPSRQGLAVMPARGGRVVLHPRATVLEPAVPEPVA